ncbi:MAG: hypothetical protein Q9163_003351 [Psora crenata]
MSLNGLEATQIHDAYQSAMTDGGCWFLLKYSTRDEVELYERGSGGLTEAQEAVRRYGEDSPLYGFIHFRRRKVVLKYVPQGTSRLLQARVAVHFQSITDKFSPIDATFSYSKPAELKESVLSSEIGLHTAASIISTSDPHLPEITEDEQDTNAEATQKAEGENVKERSQSSPSSHNGDAPREHVNETSGGVQTHRRLPSAAQSLRPRTASDTNKALAFTPDSVAHDQAKPESAYGFDAGPGNSTGGGRISSQSARPSTRDLKTAYGYKPKVKLGPRPSMDSVGRPDNSGANRVRPVSTLPAGLRMPVRKAALGRQTSEQKQIPFLAAIPPPQNPLPSRLPAATFYPPNKKMCLPLSGLETLAKTPDPKSAKMTPERRRLMKALAIRQERLAAQKSGEEEEKALVSKKSDRGREANAEGLEIEPLPDERQHQHGDMREQPRDHAKQNKSPDDKLRDEASLDDSIIVSQDLQDSPISCPEPSEGQSTQASSISDEEASSRKQPDKDKATFRVENGRKDAPMEKDVGQESVRKPVNEDTEQDIEITLATQEPELLLFVSDLSTNEPATTRPRSHGQDQCAQTSVSGHDVERQRTKVALQTKEMSVGRADNTTERPLQSPVDQVVTPAPIRVTDVPLEQQDIPKRRIEPRTGGALMLDQGSLTQADGATEHASSQPCSEYQDEAPWLQNPAFVVESTRDRLTEDTEAPNSHAYWSSPDALGVSPEQESTKESKRLCGPDDKQGRPVAADDPSPPSPPLSEARQTEESSTASNPSARQQHVQRVNISAANIQLQAPILVFPSADDEATMSGPPSSKAAIGPWTTTTITLSESPTKSKGRRRGLVNPIRRTSSPDRLDEQFLSDDLFMEELKTASVQEAKPISVSKSPIKPVFSRSSIEPRSHEKSRTLRSISSPVGNSTADGSQSTSNPPLPTAPSVRSFSGSNAPFLNPQPTIAPPSKKQIGVSSSISQRIKALEQLSSRPNSPTSQSTPQAPFVSLRDRKSSFRSHTAASDNAHQNAKSSYPTITYAAPTSEMTKPDPFKASANSRPESISVTATIIRDVMNKAPERPLNASEVRYIDLHHSPLVVEHQEMEPVSHSPLKPPRPHYARHATARSGSSSSTNDLSPTSRRGSFASKFSTSSRHGSDLDLPRSAGARSLNNASVFDGTQEDRRDSKRSRLLKRMSSISSMSRRSIASALSPSRKEAAIIEHQEPIRQTLVATTTDLGEVNIQFPDTLLWKRRHMFIDDHGVLVLCPSMTDNSSKVITRRFPLSDFQQPYVPDQDRQELAHSKWKRATTIPHLVIDANSIRGVILDCKDGSTLQCACETLEGQIAIFNS